LISPERRDRPISAAQVNGGGRPFLGDCRRSRNPNRRSIAVTSGPRATVAKLNEWVRAALAQRDIRTKL